MSATHGKNHAPKLWAKVPQLMSPIPPPHSATHCSYVSCNVGAGLVPFAAFQAFCCASFSLSPHTPRFAASTLVAKHTTNTRKANEMRAIVCPPSISVFGPEVDQDEPERASGLLPIAIRAREAVSEVGDPHAWILYIHSSHTT